MRTQPFFLILPIIFSLLSCREEQKKDSSVTCEAPVAEAGENQSISLGNVVTLNGADSQWCESLSDDLILSWSFVSVPVDSALNEGFLSENRTASAFAPQFVPDVVGEYVLSLQVNDGTSNSEDDFVIIAISAGDAAPTANCGGAYTGEEGAIISLDGSSSVDPESASLSYVWSLIPPECSGLDATGLFNGAGAYPSFVPDCDGLYMVSLVVSDGGQWSEPAICAVEVSSENRIPVADAGASQQLGGCADNPIQLNGYGSYDPDGDSLSWQWSVVTVPADSTITDASFSSTSEAGPEVAWDVPGEYTLQLQVYDGQDWSAPDLVSYTIAGLDANIRPIANAGDNQTIEVSADCQSSSYTWDCSACPATTVVLNASDSFDPDADRLNYEWTEVTGILNIASPSSAVTEVTVPEQAIDYEDSITMEYSISLTVSDCERQDDDVISLYYTCTAD
jgi:hypothetical protein